MSISAHLFCARELEKLLPLIFKFSNQIWRICEAARMVANETIPAGKGSTRDEMRRKTGTGNTGEYS
jgi:hypothetical protein